MIGERERHVTLEHGKRANKAIKQSRMHAALAIFLPQSLIDGSSLRLCVLYDGIAYEPGPASPPPAEAPVESMVAKNGFVASSRRVERVESLGMTSFR